MKARAAPGAAVSQSAAHLWCVCGRHPISHYTTPPPFLHVWKCSVLLLEPPYYRPLRSGSISRVRKHPLVKWTDKRANHWPLGVRGMQSLDEVVSRQAGG